MLAYWKNEREVPIEFLPSRKRSIRTSIFEFTNRMTLASYVPKVGKTVILISSMHYTSNMNRNEVNKQQARNNWILQQHQGRNRCVRWEMYCLRVQRAFQTMANDGGLWNFEYFLSDTFIIFSASPHNPQISRYVYIKSPARQLVVPHMERRLENKRLARSQDRTLFLFQERICLKLKERNLLN